MKFRVFTRYFAEIFITVPVMENIVGPVIVTKYLNSLIIQKTLLNSFLIKYIVTEQFKLYLNYLLANRLDCNVNKVFKIVLLYKRKKYGNVKLTQLFIDLACPQFRRVAWKTKDATIY